MANLNINKIVLGGRLTSDVELKKTPQGTSVASFSIAVNRKGKDAGTDFINCVAWRSIAEVISNYFTKGSSIVVTGSLQVRSWKDQQGNNRYATEVNVEEAYFVDSKSDGQAFETPAFQTPSAPKFEEVTGDEDIPF